jgi:hypothetical protein
MKIHLPLLALLLLGAAGLTGCDAKRELVCAQGTTDCGGRCVSLDTDSQNCGACGRAVGPLQICAAAAAACAPGIDLCGATCTDLARDPGNCGACGAACAADRFCTTDAGSTACTDSCPGGFAACGRSCVALATDRYHCGACGHACGAGESCRDGACRADLYVACYATNELVPRALDLSPAGPGRATGGSPTALAVGAGAVWAADGYPGSLSVVPLDASLPTREVAIAGSNDLEYVTLHSNVFLATSADLGVLIFLSSSGTILDEVAMPRQQTGPNPRGLAISGTTAYVALSGTGAGNGQSIATLDLSGLPACAASPGTGGCAVVTGELDLAAVPGAADAPGLPFPSDVLEAQGRIFVTLGNLEEDVTPWGSYWVKPAGHGRLAVIDPSAGNAISIVDLGAGCGNPGAMALTGSTAWIACGSFAYGDLAPSALLPVDISVSPPAVGRAVPMAGIVPGRLAFCGGATYVTDQASGAVVRIDAAGTPGAPVDVCPASAYGWAWAADVACPE